MLFEKGFLVETTHTATNHKVDTMKIAHGIITWISVLYPTGCHGMVHGIIRHHEHQIAPSTEEMNIIGDGIPIQWTEYYEIYQPPYELKIELWGVDCTYNHTVTIRVAILPRKAILALAVVDAFKSLFGLFSPRRIFTRKEVEVE